MNLYHCECAELNCLNVFAIDKDRAQFLVKVYLEFNYAEHVKYRVGKTSTTSTGHTVPSSEKHRMKASVKGSNLTQSMSRQIVNLTPMR